VTLLSRSRVQGAGSGFSNSRPRLTGSLPDHRRITDPEEDMDKGMTTRKGVFFVEYGCDLFGLSSAT
jgi:hypothetical protein